MPDSSATIPQRPPAATAPVQRPPAAPAGVQGLPAAPAAMHPTPAAPAPVYRPRLGRDGDRCASCGGPLASDQRYCLGCGARRGEARLPFLEILLPPRQAPAPAPPPPPARRHQPPPPPFPSLVAVASGIAAAAVLGVGLLGGALIVRHNQRQTPIVVQASPPVVNVAGGAAPTAAPAPAPAAAIEPANAVFTADWPAGQNGWTVRLATLPKDGTAPAAVAAAKTAAQDKGVPDVGALDSDAFASLDPGSYLVYSGVYSSQSQADAALAGVAGSYPDAAVVEVGSGEPPAAEEPAQQSQSPENAQENIRKAPPTVESEGTPAPKDDEEPGGGSESTTIG